MSRKKMTCEKLISGLKKFGFCLTISKDMAQKSTGNNIYPDEYPKTQKRREPLKVKTKEIDEVDACRIIYVYGMLDANTGYILQEEIDKALAAGVVNFIFDLEDLNYISSQSIGIFGNLKDTVKPYKGDVAMYGLHGKVLEMFTLLGFASYFIVTNDIYEAIGELLTKDTTEEEEIVYFPKTFNCPICQAKLTAQKQGVYNCSKCKTRLLVNPKGEISII